MHKSGVAKTFNKIEFFTDSPNVHTQKNENQSIGY
jgi:hypothetical protein